MLQKIKNLPIIVQTPNRIHAIASNTVNKKMHPNNTMAGKNGCLKLLTKTALPFGCIPSTKTMTTKPTIKIGTKIQHSNGEITASFDKLILMRMDKIAANKPESKTKRK